MVGCCSWCFVNCWGIGGKFGGKWWFWLFGSDGVVVGMKGGGKLNFGGIGICVSDCGDIKLWFVVGIGDVVIGGFIEDNVCIVWYDGVFVE